MPAINDPLLVRGARVPRACLQLVVLFLPSLSADVTAAFALGSSACNNARHEVFEQETTETPIRNSSLFTTLQRTGIKPSTICKQALECVKMKTCSSVPSKARPLWARTPRSRSHPSPGLILAG